MQKNELFEYDCFIIVNKNTVLKNKLHNFF